MSERDDQGFTPAAAPQETGPEDAEYVFRFRIGSSNAGQAAYDDPLVELLRGQLADLLEAVILTDHGRPVRVDGFVLLQEPDRQYEIFPQSGRPPRADGAE